MAKNEITITGGFDDVEDLQEIVPDTIKGILLNFANELQKDLRGNIDKKKHNYTGKLSQSLSVKPKIVETKESIIYTLEYPMYGERLNKGVKGEISNFQSPFKFGQNGVPNPSFTGLEKWAANKFGLNLQDKEVKPFAYFVKRKHTLFGLKPTYWADEIINDGRFEELQEELGKRIGLVIIERI